MRATSLALDGRMVAVMMALAGAAGSAEFHVAVDGTDRNAGTPGAPLRTIQRAADLARPGDTITVHAGTYRERVNPPRGGESDAKRITYRAAPGEKVEIKGSEPIKGWVKAQHDTWKVTLPNRFFGTFNPYDDDHLIKGGWFEDKGRKHHPGAVYLNGDWLLEADRLDDVMKPADKTPLWFGEVKGSSTTIWAQFKGVDPNEREVEINVRQTVFYPGLPGRNYITVSGFILRNAATPWAPPAVEQIGLIGPHWSKGWIIEDNTISHSACVGISLGKYGDGLDQTAYKEWFTGSVKRALADGWSRDAIGHHIVRHNRISHCEQAGIVGSLGCAFSTVDGNTIHDIHVRRRFNGAEMAALKFHGAIDVVITGNQVYRSEMGIWLDWMAQGARVSGNLLHDNRFGDLHIEVNHGPYVIDNNLFLSPAPSRVYNVSQGGAYIHNLFGGSLLRFVANGKRSTPYHQPHATEIVDIPAVVGGDDRFYNNLFVKTQLLANYEKPMPSQFAGNVYLAVAKAHWAEKRTPLVVPEYDAKAVRLEQKADGWYLALTFDPAWVAARRRSLVTSELLGKAKVPNATYENPDGSPLRVATDYHGKRRDESNPTPGPFENPGSGSLLIKVH